VSSCDLAGDLPDSETSAAYNQAQICGCHIFNEFEFVFGMYLRMKRKKPMGKAVAEEKKCTSIYDMIVLYIPTYYNYDIISKRCSSVTM
jgi:hypothetical protein